VSRQSRDLAILFILGLVVNGAVAAMTSTPGYVDAYYYANGGEFIARGSGQLEPYLWSYVFAPPGLPAPSFAYWRPLPSILAAIGIVAFPGMKPFDASQIPFVVMAALLPVVTYVIGLRIGVRRHALLGGLLMVFSGYFVLNWSNVETFTPFALAGASSLGLVGKGRTDGRWWVWTLAGLCAGLAHLARADGVLLIGIALFIIALPGNQTTGSQRVRSGLLVILGYLLVIGPWIVRNRLVLDGMQGANGFNTLWLVDYNDLFRYPNDLSASIYFSTPVQALLSAKWQALLANLATWIGVVNLIFLTPFSFAGFWKHWKEEFVLPAAIYLVTLFGAMTFAFTLPGARGGWFHSSGALMPFVLPLSMVGLDDSITWVARRRVGWNAAQARNVFGAAVVAFSILLTGFLVIRGIVGLPFRGANAWNGADQLYSDIGQTLTDEGAPPDARVMVNNPPGFFWHTGHGGVPVPAGDEVMLLKAADDYHIDYLVLDENIVTALQPLFSQQAVSPRLRLITSYGSEDHRTFLYQVLPQQNPTAGG